MVASRWIVQFSTVPDKMDTKLNESERLEGLVGQEGGKEGGGGRALRNDSELSPEKPPAPVVLHPQRENMNGKTVTSNEMIKNTEIITLNSCSLKQYLHRLDDEVTQQLNSNFSLYWKGQVLTLCSLFSTVIHV